MYLNDVFLVTYPPAQVINDAIEKNKGVDAAYADLFSSYPADLRMAEDLATFVRIISLTTTSLLPGHLHMESCITLKTFIATKSNSSEHLLLQHHDWQKMKRSTNDDHMTINILYNQTVNFIRNTLFIVDRDDNRTVAQ